MSKTYRRPMFRKGGSTGEGIMHQVSKRSNFQGGTPDPDIERRKELLRQAVGKSKGTPVSDLLIRGGLNLIAGKGAGGGTLESVAGAFQEPTEAFFKESAADDQFERQLGLSAATSVLGQRDKERLKRMGAGNKMSNYQSRVNLQLRSIGKNLSTATSEEIKDAVAAVNKLAETSPGKTVAEQRSVLTSKGGTYYNHPDPEGAADAKIKYGSKIRVVPSSAYTYNKNETALSENFKGAVGIVYYEPLTNEYFEFKITPDADGKPIYQKIPVSEESLGSD